MMRLGKKCVLSVFMRKWSDTGGKPAAGKTGTSGVFLTVGVVGVVLHLVAAPASAGPIPPDVDLRLITLDSPSAVTDTTDLGALPGQRSVFDIGESFILELWASDVGAVNTGITGFYVDLTYDNTIIQADTLLHSPGSFSLLPEGVIDNPSGLVVNFGGNDITFAGQGVEPLWTRVGYVNITAIAGGSSEILSTIGIGGIGVLGRQPPAPSEAQLGSATVTVGDCNSNGVADGMDIAIGSSLDCNENTIPDECEFPGCPGILAGDMNCDVAVNGLDIDGFVAFLLDGQYTCQADLNQDGSLDTVDLGLFVELLILS